MGGLVRTSSKLILITPTVDTNIYASADVIGTVQTVTAAVLDNGGTCLLESLVVIDKSNSKSALDLVFFNEAPGTTIGADNAAYALVDGDANKILGRISVAAADYVSSSTTNAEATIKSIGLLLAPIAGSKNIFMAVVSRGTPTYGTSADLSIRLGLLQD